MSLFEYTYIIDHHEKEMLSLKDIVYDQNFVIKDQELKIEKLEKMVEKLIIS